MSEYGITDKGFVIKRLDSILEEVHSDLTDGFGFDTRVGSTSYLNVLVTTFAGQIADLWETAQDSYYSKYPATATGLNLDNAVQYGGIRRKPNKRTLYALHCTGDDGTRVREKTLVATNTMPEQRLFSIDDFVISREKFNVVEIEVAVSQTAVYSITINGTQYSYSSIDGIQDNILNGLKEKIGSDNEFLVEVQGGRLKITDKTKSRSNELILSDNLTTASVTTIANFHTEEYGKITLPHGIVTKIINNITGLEAVTNSLDPIYGRLEETDIELRQSYIAKSALRSNTMLDSIVSELLNNVRDVESASGYENDTDKTDSRGLPPHSVEIVVEGGDNNDIAQAILRRKAAGIQTHGSIIVNVPGNYGDTIPIKFNRPEYLYTWMKVVLHGERKLLPINYATMAISSILRDGARLTAGRDLLIQKVLEGLYKDISGVNYIDISVASSTNKSHVPGPSEYKQKNVIATERQKVLIGETRIEVSFVED